MISLQYVNENEQPKRIDTPHAKNENKIQIIYLLALRRIYSMTDEWSGLHANNKSMCKCVEMEQQNSSEVLQSLMIRIRKTD